MSPTAAACALASPDWLNAWASLLRRLQKPNRHRLSCEDLRIRRTGEALLRVKGILNLAGEAAPVAIHGVHHVFHPPVQLAAWSDSDRRSRLVFITRGLARAEVEESWRFCVEAVQKYPPSR